jgi:pimeloyl-ACP methyl ester carboxylesterase
VAAADDDHVEFAGKKHGKLRTGTRIQRSRILFAGRRPRQRTPLWPRRAHCVATRFSFASACLLLGPGFVRDFRPVLVGLKLVVAQIPLHARLRLISLIAILGGSMMPCGTLVAAADIKLVTEPCRLENPSGLSSVAARCGYLVVAENPEAPAGLKIRLHVAVIAALRSQPSAEPLFIVAGGPGSAASQFYAAAAPAFERIRRERDLVVVDQRGTGLSNRLDCDFPENFDVDQLALDRLRELIKGCREHLKAHQLEYYTTSVAVRDLDQVRAALGYERIALYGVSYGTRVVEHYARRFANRARAVILDGAIVPETPVGPAIALDAQSTLNRIFRACERDPACTQKFPNLAPRFVILLDSVTRKPRALDLADPVTGRSEHLAVTRDYIVAAVRLLSYNSQTVAVLPLLLDEAARGNLTPLVAQAVMSTRALSDQLSIGMHNSVVCAEDVPFYADAKIDRDLLAQTYIGTNQVDGLIEICKIWPRGVADPDLHAPLRSKVPALVLSGELDPVTPPANGVAVAKEFSDSLHIVAAGQGHGQLATGCIPRLMAQFIDAGTTRKLDAGCAKAIVGLPFFLDFSGPAP